jgi:hypothetical protein
MVRPRVPTDRHGLFPAVEAAHHSTPTVFRYLTDCLDDTVLADLRVVLQLTRRPWHAARPAPVNTSRQAVRSATTRASSISYLAGTEVPAALPKLRARPNQYDLRRSRTPPQVRRADTHEGIKGTGSGEITGYESSGPSLRPPISSLPTTPDDSARPTPHPWTTWATTSNSPHSRGQNSSTESPQPLRGTPSSAYRRALTLGFNLQASPWVARSRLLVGGRFGGCWSGGCGEQGGCRWCVVWRARTAADPAGAG